MAMAMTSSPTKEMEKLSKTNQTPPKQAKKARRRAPVKVVYISTPVRVETTATEFRSRVIELTGRDSDIANMSPVDDFPEASQHEPDLDINMPPFEMLDESFNPYMVENLSTYYGISPSRLFKKRSHKTLIDNEDDNNEELGFVYLPIDKVLLEL